MLKDKGIKQMQDKRLLDPDDIFFIPSLYEKLPELKGKNVACWCPISQPCHGDILLEIANREF
jgi:hypothetical protein